MPSGLGCRGCDRGNPNKALWEKGDFTRIAESMRESEEALVKSFGIRKGGPVYGPTTTGV